MKRTIAEQIIIEPNGIVQVRFGLQRVNDDGTPDGPSKTHRDSYDVDADIDAKIAALNESLAGMDEAPVAVECVTRIKAHAAIARTPEAFAAHAERMAKIQAEIDAQNEAREKANAVSQAAEDAKYDAAVARYMESRGK